jgi:hypothetical protein
VIAGWVAREGLQSRRDRAGRAHARDRGRRDGPPDRGASRDRPAAACGAGACIDGVLHRPADDDDGLQRWLEGRPGWPLAAAADAESEPTLAVRVVGDGALLHRAAARHAVRESAALRHGDAATARRARELVVALMQELRA